VLVYKAFVRYMVRRTLAHLSARRLDGLMARFGVLAVFHFHGDHALGGEARGAAAIRAVFERMYRLFPDLHVEPVTVLVNGWPWDTRIASRLAVRGRLPDGSMYRNEGMQFARIRWGRVVEDHLYEDTDVLQRALRVIADHGVPEACAGALNDSDLDPVPAL
jgi:ketosteroid isomerase-like protein